MTGKQRLRQWISDERPDPDLVDSAARVRQVAPVSRCSAQDVAPGIRVAALDTADADAGRPYAFAPHQVAAALAEFQVVDGGDGDLASLHIPQFSGWSGMSAMTAFAHGIWTARPRQLHGLPVRAAVAWMSGHRRIIGRFGKCGSGAIKKDLPETLANLVLSDRFSHVFALGAVPPPRCCMIFDMDANAFGQRDVHRAHGLSMALLPSFGEPELESS